MATKGHYLEKDEWVETQFRIYKKHEPISLYRDVLLITSFIEAVIRKEASSKTGNDSLFKPSLKVLELDIDDNDEMISEYKDNCQYKDSCLIEINRLRVQRNGLLHDILDAKKSHEDITKTINNMAKEIKQVCCESKLFRDYFKTNHSFDPAAIIQNSNQP